MHTIWIQIRTDRSGSKLFDTDNTPERVFLKIFILKNVSRGQQKHEKLPSMQRVKGGFAHVQ